MTVVGDYLRLRGVPIEEIEHPRAATSVDEATALGVPADEVLKTLVVDRWGGHVLVVIPSSRRTDMGLVRVAVCDHHAHLATESELSHDFSGYELGAMPPLGSLVGAETYVDPEVFAIDSVVFSAGSQTESIRARTEDLFRGEHIKVVPLTAARAREREKVSVT
jgi:prolyl-tRNA editing enzyme YbaK/EbsC (Cys-tRNA(Pro) deacylase)